MSCGFVFCWIYILNMKKNNTSLIFFVCHCSSASTSHLKFFLSIIYMFIVQATYWRSFKVKVAAINLFRICYQKLNIVIFLLTKGHKTFESHKRTLIWSQYWFRGENIRVIRMVLSIPVKIFPSDADWRKFGGLLKN